MMSGSAQIQVDESMVREIAALARLDLTGAETEMFVAQFQDILEYIGILNEVDTASVPPAYLSSARQSVMREDRIEDSIPTGEFLANAPEAQDDYVVTPRVHSEG